MKITSIKIIPVYGDEKLKAYVNIVIDSCFAVHDLKIIQKDEKMFVAMPSRKSKKQNIFRDIAHPLDSETREMIEKMVLEEYTKVVNSHLESINTISSLEKITKV